MQNYRENFRVLIIDTKLLITSQMNFHFYMKTIRPPKGSQNFPSDVSQTHSFAHPIEIISEEGRELYCGIIVLYL